jgi:DNA-binding response OmpR family regulator
MDQPGARPPSSPSDEDFNEKLMAARKRMRILICDDEVILAERLVSFLKSNGFEARHASSGPEVAEALRQWHPQLVVYDLMLRSQNAVAFLKMLGNQGLLGPDRVQVFVMSGHNNPNNVREVLKLGAIDFIVKPIKPADFLSRVIFHLQKKREIPEYKPQHEKDVETAQYFLYLVDSILREAQTSAPADAVLHRLSVMVAMAMKAVRVSVVRCDLESKQGEVIASNDNKDINRLKIDLNKYPEILHVLRSDKQIALDNLASDPAMHFVLKAQKNISFNSLAVVPMKIDGRSWGVLSIRMAESKESVSEFEIRFSRAMASVLGVIVSRDPELSRSLKASPSAPKAG